MRKPGSSRRSLGVALVSALMLMVIILIIASAFVHLTARDVRSARTVGDSLLTMYLAEAGIEWAMWMNKHNMDMYPSDSYDINDDGASDARGSVVWLLKNNLVTPQEHVLVNDLSFDSYDNWLAKVEHCGTFQVSQTVTQDAGYASQWIIKITSIGRIRKVPSGWVWSSTTLNTSDLASANWALRSQRTLTAEVKINTDVSTAPSVSYSTQPRVEEQRWYELFR